MRRMLKIAAFSLAIVSAGAVTGAVPSHAGLISETGEVVRGPSLCITVIDNYGPVNAAVPCANIISGRVAGLVWAMVAEAGESAGIVAGTPGLCISILNTHGPVNGAIPCTVFAVGSVAAAVYNLVL